MKALMHRMIVLGGAGVLLSVIATGCTLSGSGAAPLTTSGPGDFTNFDQTPTEIGVFPTADLGLPGGGITDYDLTSTALYSSFGVTPGLEGPTGFETATPFGFVETPIGSGIDTTPGFVETPFGTFPTATPMPPLPISTPTPTPLSVVATPVPGVAGGSCPATYTVQSGDNLYRIALRFGLTYQELAAANGITNPDSVEVGTVLTIPGCGGNSAAPSAGGGTSGGSVQPLAGDTVAANGDILHTVKAGENLFRIALSYGLKWEKVAAYNGITNPDDISVGQVIHIPPN